jgi:hypothetical protein
MMMFCTFYTSLRVEFRLFFIVIFKRLNNHISNLVSIEYVIETF